MAGRPEHEPIHTAIIQEGANQLRLGHALSPDKIREIAAQHGHQPFRGLTAAHFLRFSQTDRHQLYWGDVPVVEHEVTRKTSVICSADIPFDQTDTREVISKHRDVIRAANTRGVATKRLVEAWLN